MSERHLRACDSAHGFLVAPDFFVPLHRPYIGLIYGRYLHFRILKWPLTERLFNFNYDSFKHAGITSTHFLWPDLSDLSIPFGIWSTWSDFHCHSHQIWFHPFCPAVVLLRSKKCFVHKKHLRRCEGRIQNVMYIHCFFPSWHWATGIFLGDLKELVPLQFGHLRPGKCCHFDFALQVQDCSPLTAPGSSCGESRNEGYRGKTTQIADINPASPLEPSHKPGCLDLIVTDSETCGCGSKWKT